MAGLGEVCTHVAAVLFYLETSFRLQGKATCTQDKCQWVIPAYQKSIPYSPVKDLDFTSAKGKKRKIDCALAYPTPSVAKCPRKPVAVNPPSDDELVKFYKTLSECGSKPAILSVTLPYANDFQPKTSRSNFPQLLPELYKEEYLEMGYMKLLDTCCGIEVKVTSEMVDAVERATRDQSGSNLWFKCRAGRITASRMKSVCHSDPANPAQSLIKVICYPEAFKFVSAATSWGCRHEKCARDTYVSHMMAKHIGFEVSDSGLVINPAWSHIGASPDGKVKCSCCTIGVVEIKCPFCHRNDTINDSVTQDKKFCLNENTDGTLTLDRSHAYYYQVQTQIFVCGVEYADFVVCTFPEDNKPVIHVERIMADIEFWSQCVKKSTEFFTVCILPELLGRWYTRPCISSKGSTHPPGPSSESIPECSSLSESQANSAAKKYCYCQDSENDGDEMIACDYSHCAIEWFHTRCLKITTIPSGRWYCPTCRKLPECKRRKKK